MKAFSVLMLVPNYYPYVGGLERQAHTLGRALVRRGHSVAVWTRRADKALSRSELLDGVQVERLPSASGDRAGADLLYPLSLLVRLAREAHNYDVLHAHSKSWFVAGAMLPALLWRRPLLLKMPNVREFGIPGALRKPFGRQQVWLLRQASAWAVLSPESRDELVAAGFAPQRIFETRNGVDTYHYTPASPDERTAARSALGLPQARPIALFAGRFTHQKGLPDLVAAWQRLPSLALRPALVACGDGPLRDELAARAQSAGIDLILPGSQREMRQFYHAADLFVLPSYAEGNSNAMLEAMASGLPVVSTRVGGSAELLGPAAAEWLVEPGDIAGLTERLARLLGNSALRSGVGAALLRRARENFAIDAIAAEYETCYRLLVAGQQHRLAALGQARES